MYSEEYQLYIVGNVISQECTRIQKKYFVLICTQIEFWSVEKSCDYVIYKTYFHAYIYVIYNRCVNDVYRNWKGSSQTQEILRACKVKII